MAGPVAGFVQLPTDSGNTGKKIQTQSEVIGADTVHTHFFVSRSLRKILGVYGGVLALQSVAAAAQNGTSTAACWMEIPSGSTVRARVRKIELAFTNAVATAVDHATAPRIVAARFTFTGSASGATIAPAKRRATDAANVANIRTASTGMTVSLVANWWHGVVPGVDITTSGVYNSFFLQEFDPVSEEDYFDFAAGEGLVIYQADAGTTSDQRRYGVNIRWDEYDNA